MDTILTAISEYPMESLLLLGLLLLFGMLVFMIVHALFVCN